MSRQRSPACLKSSHLPAVQGLQDQLCIQDSGIGLCFNCVLRLRFGKMHSTTAPAVHVCTLLVCCRAAPCWLWTECKPTTGQSVGNVRASARTAVVADVLLGAHALHLLLAGVLKRRRRLVRRVPWVLGL